MPDLQSHPDNLTFSCSEGETLLEAALRAGLPMAHACGGHGKCSTCRVWVMEGAAQCPDRNATEARLASQLGLDPSIRLACQLRPQDRIAFRRLVLDETDMALASQLGGRKPAKAGELREIAVFFSDIQGFTTLSEGLLPYDVMYMLNRFFAQTGEAVEADGGYIDKFLGDGMMALFGINGEADAPLRAVHAGLQCLAAADRMQPFFETMYGIRFEIRIGIHWGQAVIGSLGAPGHERLTAVGDAVNMASRTEQANKEAGTRFLITDTLYEKVEQSIEVADFIRVRLPGTSDRHTLYEVASLRPDAVLRLTGKAEPGRKRFAGRDWTLLMEAAELPEGGHRVFEFQDFDLVLLRRAGQFFALNNACPHVNLPLFNRQDNLAEPEKLRPDESITEGGELVCRWHQSRFDLASGEVLSWCKNLNEDGTSQGMEQLGDLSKNRCPLRLFPLHVAGGQIWAALDT